jgi:hypothetical protein
MENHNFLMGKSTINDHDTGWWFGTFGKYLFGNVIIPIDFHIFQRGRYTTNQRMNMYNDDL